MPTVHTNDENERNEFKARQLKRINASLEQHIAPAPKRLRVNVPVNFSELGEQYIHQYLLNSKLTPEQSTEVIRFLFADQQTESFELEVVITGKQSKPAEVAPVIETPIKKLALELPHSFKSLQVKDQYLWLSKQSGFNLSHEEVNDVIDLLQDKPTRAKNTVYDISFCQYELPAVVYTPGEKKRKAKTGVKRKKLEYSIETEELRTHIDVNLPENFSSLKEFEQHHVLVTKFQLFADEATDIIRIHKEDGDTEFTVVRPEAQSTTTEEVKTSPVVDLVLPYGFLTITPAQQFAYLQNKFSPELAHDAIAHLTGKPQTTNTVFKVEYSKEIEHKDNPVADFAKAKAERALALSTRIAEQIEASRQATPTKKSEPKPVAIETKTYEVVLPHDFASYRLADQSHYLKSVLHFTTSEADEIVAALAGSPVTNVYNISYAEPIHDYSNPIEDFVAAKAKKSEAIAARAKFENEIIAETKRKAEALKVEAKAKAEQLTLEVVVPKGVLNSSASQQYTYFTKNLKLPTETANQLVASITGQQTPIKFRVIIED